MLFDPRSLRQIRLLNTFMYTTDHKSQNVRPPETYGFGTTLNTVFWRSSCAEPQKTKTSLQTRIINLFFSAQGKKDALNFLISQLSISETYTLLRIILHSLLFSRHFSAFYLKMTSPNGLEDILNIRREKKKSWESGLFAIQQMARAQQSRDYYGMHTDGGVAES